MWGCGCSWTGSAERPGTEPARDGPVPVMRSGLRRAVLLASLLAGVALRPAPALARGAPADTTPGARPDTAAAPDTSRGAVPDTTPGTAGDTAARRDTSRAAGSDTAQADSTRARKAPPFPEALEPSDPALAVDVHTWDRSQILASASQSLLDFLEWEVPGLTALRVGYFGGPHVVQDGVLGPGFLQVVVDGRQLDPLEGSTLDLLRIALVQVERIRVVRGAGRLRIEVTTLHHGREPAYSSIQGGTGRPSLNLVRGAFANGLGRHVQLAAAGDFMEVTGGPTPANGTDGWARVGWMPEGGKVGLEVRGRSQSLERTVVENTKFTRTELAVHGRADLASWLQADAWGARERRSPDTTAAATGPAPTVTDDQASLSLTAAGEGGFGRAVVRARSGSAYPSLEGQVEGGFGPLPWLRVSATARTASWKPFRTTSAEVAVRAEPHLPGSLGLVLHGSAATGSRGVPRPLSGAGPDSLSFDALAGSAELTLGPYALAGRGTWQRLSRQLPFGFAFDSALSAGPGTTVGGFEGRLEGPLIPVAALADRVRVRGVWRRNVRMSGGSLRYLPGDQAFGEVEFRDAFFQNSLHLRLAFGLTYRGVTATASPGHDGTELLPSQTLALGRAEIRIDRFRIWWVGRDFEEIDTGDIAGIPHPLAPNVVGVTWEWSN